MKIEYVLNEVLQEECHGIHNKRLNAVLDVAEGLRNSQNLSLIAIGRALAGEGRAKHKIKKVDRCLGNKRLHGELVELYGGLTQFVFRYVEEIKDSPIVIDLCYLKDDRMIQMLSAQLCAKGMTLPLYQEVFKEGELKGRCETFLKKLINILPEDKQVVIVMDAGFHIEWFKLIEDMGWSWVCRIRQGKDLKLGNMADWISVKDYIPMIGMVTKDQGKAKLTKTHAYDCRIVTTCKEPAGRKQKISRHRTSSKIANSSYSNAAKEPWILATNLEEEKYKGSEIVAIYGKRMQIEEAFRAIKSHQFGLAARYIRTEDVNRWGVLMLIAAIVLISYWVIGVIGHSQGMQRLFQANTTSKRIYSYFTLGKFIIEYNKLSAIPKLEQTLSSIIAQELNHV